jgi:hypothetical protein
MGTTLLYYNRVSTVIKDRILGKTWEAQLAMLNVGKKCWVGFVKKWLFKNHPQEVASSLPSVQVSLEMALQLAMTRAFQVKTAQLLLETAFRTTHIHMTRLVGVRGRAESRVLWCSTHNVQAGVRMAKLATLELMQPVGAKSTTKGSIN